ncbi:MAG: YdcF family protein [bacterium]|nr:YdcF family protein [bacterium]
MLTILLALIGIICGVYGFFILSVGSGTGFYAVWFIIAGIFFLVAAGVHFDFFKHLSRAIKITLLAFVIIIAGTFTVEGGFIASKFGEAGKQGLDYIIVLGAQVKESGPSVVLQYRLDEAARYLRENPETICIVSGGQGPNEPYTEGSVMYSYLVKRGIDPSRIIVEDKASTTRENIEFSMELMDSPDSSVGIVTNNFHVFRGVRIAKKLGLTDVCGIAAKSRPIYLPNNVLREFFGITKNLIQGYL